MDRAIAYLLWIAAVALPMFLAAPGIAGDYVFTVRGEKTYINDSEILVKGLRCSNALGIHHAKRVAGKPYIESEATPGKAPGGYWGKYSKKDGYYNYINIGLYTEAMKTDQIKKTKDHLSRGEGYMLASTWLQCVPPHGPNHKPGGDGSENNPGIRWWLEFLRQNYGPYTPPTTH